MVSVQATQTAAKVPRTKLHKKKNGVAPIDIGLYLLVIIPVIYFVVFKYIPMLGITIAFKDYNIFKGIFGSEWVGFDIFKELFTNNSFLLALRNTVFLSLGEFIMGIPAPIILALFLNELKNKHFKKMTQSILYLPHFLSWVIVGGLILQLFTQTGLINNMLSAFGIAPKPFLTDQSMWVGVFLTAGVWKGAGWGTIIYLAALTGISEEVYEAARVDGCGRFKLMWYITLPGIRHTMIVVIILGMGGIIDVGLEKIMALKTPYVSEISDVISTYVYRVGMQSLRYNIATAAGIFQALVSIILVSVTNYMSKKFEGEGVLW